MVNPKKAEGRNHALLCPSQDSSLSLRGCLYSILLSISVCRLESKGLGPGNYKVEAFFLFFFFFLLLYEWLKFCKKSFCFLLVLSTCPPLALNSLCERKKKRKMKRRKQGRKERWKEGEKEERKEGKGENVAYGW